MTGDTVVVSAAMAQRPARAGHAWALVNWLLGFRSLGLRVLFVDRIDESMGQVDSGVRWVRDVMNSVGLSDAWCVQVGEDDVAGLPRADLLRRARGALLLNVMGYLDDHEVWDACAVHVFLDIDPGFGQAWQQDGSARLFEGHDAYATVGLNVGRPGCGVPDLDIDWIPTVPPVDLDAWRAPSPPVGCFTTVGSWRGPFAPVEVDGTRHGLRVHQARPLARLPRRTNACLEIALDIDAADEADRQLLLDGGWRLRDPREVAGDVAAYRSYVHGSLAEFAVAKQIYVDLRTGWVSDRSACYLASGRPVVVTDTGLAAHLPVGDGLLTYTTADEAAAAIEVVQGDPDKQSQVALELAGEHFAAGKVARTLLERVW